jgi:hypothetical protein
MIRVAAVLLTLLLAPWPAVAADSPVGTWKTIDDKTGQALSEIQIMDPEDGKTYEAELWVEDGKLKVRGYLGFFYRTQTWVKA